MRGIYLCMYIKQKENFVENTVAAWVYFLQFVNLNLEQQINNDD